MGLAGDRILPFVITVRTHAIKDQTLFWYTCPRPAPGHYARAVGPGTPPIINLDFPFGPDT